ncbi:hypothetical protein CP8484711_2001B, partial [Chlamydia psittaci 84-8471/1]
LLPRIRRSIPSSSVCNPPIPEPMITPQRRGSAGRLSLSHLDIAIAFLAATTA